MPIRGRNEAKAAELKKFRQQYRTLHKNLILIAKTIGKDWTEEGYVSFVYEDAKIRVSINNDNCISVSVRHGLDESTTVFQDFLTLEEYIKYSRYRDDKIHEGDTWDTYTKDDVTYRPGKWVEYVNGDLMQKVEQEIDDEKAKVAWRDYNRAAKHDPFDDSDIFG